MKLLLLLTLCMCVLCNAVIPIAKREPAEYCIRYGGMQSIEVEELHEATRRYLRDRKKYQSIPRISESVLYLPEEYQRCKWTGWGVNAKFYLNEDIYLAGFYGIIKTSPPPFQSREMRDSALKYGGEAMKVPPPPDKYDSISISDISSFQVFHHKYEIYSPLYEKHSYGTEALQLLKESFGKTLMMEIEVSTTCPDEIDDKKREKLKYSYPIKIVGECSADTFK